MGEKAAEGEEEDEMDLKKLWKLISTVVISSQEHCRMLAAFCKGFV